MRAKPLVGTNVGVLLDRIRMLMISVGISVGQNRELAEKVQAIVSKKLREGAMHTVSKMPSDTPEEKAIKQTLAVFFAKLKWTRDIDPIEEIGSAIPDVSKILPKSEIEGQFILLDDLKLEANSYSTIEARIKISKMVMKESTNVVKRLFFRLLRPDPWGDNH
ncbi:MAG: hypothetical protein ACFE7R_02455 [Candidatus Hodarchaeota archaeon]